MNELKGKENAAVIPTWRLTYSNTVDACPELGVNNVTNLNFLEWIKIAFNDCKYNFPFSMVTISGSNKRLFIVRPKLTTALKEDYEEIPNHFKDDLIKNICKRASLNCVFLGKTGEVYGEYGEKEWYESKFKDAPFTTSYYELRDFFNYDNMKQEYFSEDHCPRNLHVIYDWQLFVRFTGDDIRNRPLESLVGYFWELIRGNFPSNPNSILIFDNYCAGEPYSFDSWKSCASADYDAEYLYRIEVEV